MREPNSASSKPKSAWQFSVPVRVLPGETLGMSIQIDSTRSGSRMTGGGWCMYASANLARPVLGCINPQGSAEICENRLTFVRNGMHAWFILIQPTRRGRFRRCSLRPGNSISNIEAPGAITRLNGAYPGSVRVGDRIVAVDGTPPEMAQVGARQPKDNLTNLISRLFSPPYDLPEAPRVAQILITNLRRRVKQDTLAAINFNQDRF